MKKSNGCRTLGNGVDLRAGESAPDRPLHCLVELHDVGRALRFSQFVNDAVEIKEIEARSLLAEDPLHVFPAAATFRDNLVDDQVFRRTDPHRETLDGEFHRPAKGRLLIRQPGKDPVDANPIPGLYGEDPGFLDKAFGICRQDGKLLPDLSQEEGKILFVNMNGDVQILGGSGHALRQVRKPADYHVRDRGILKKGNDLQQAFFQFHGL